MKLCPYKFGYYEFEGGQDCIGTECGMFKRCANDTLAAENDVSATSVDANDVNAMQDSREKLEADVIRLLDRQAAITEQRHLELTGAFQLESDKRITELQAKVDEYKVMAHANSEGWKRSADKVDELTAELTAARNAHAQAEHEAVILREKLGRMLDNAHEISRIGGDVTP